MKKNNYFLFLGIILFILTSISFLYFQIDEVYHGSYSTKMVYVVKDEPIDITEKGRIYEYSFESLPIKDKYRVRLSIKCNRPVFNKDLYKRYKDRLEEKRLLAQKIIPFAIRIDIFAKNKFLKSELLTADDLDAFLSAAHAHDNVCFFRRDVLSSEPSIMYIVRFQVVQPPPTDLIDSAKLCFFNSPESPKNALGRFILGLGNLAVGVLIALLLISLLLGVGFYFNSSKRK